MQSVAVVILVTRWMKDLEGEEGLARVSKFLVNEGHASYLLLFNKPPTSCDVKQEHLYYALAKILFILQNNKKLMKNIFRSNVEYLYFNFLNSGMKCLIQEKANINNSYAHLGYSGALYNITKEWINGDCLGDMIEVIDALFMVFTGGEKMDNVEMKQTMINEAMSETKK